MISINNPSSDISIYSSDLLDKDVIVNRRNSRWIASDKSRTKKIINVILKEITVWLSLFLWQDMVKAY